MDFAQQLVSSLRQKVLNRHLPQEVEVKLLTLLQISGSLPELEKLHNYIEFVIALPFDKSGQDILDLGRAGQILDKNHYGLRSVKDRILEYLSVLILNRQKSPNQLFHAPILAFIGLVGSGKTSMAYSIAESLGRPIVRIPFGGLGSVTQLRGQSRFEGDAEPGQIVKGLKTAGVKNPVILLDELDRVAEGGRVDIMGVLVELLDPRQNQAFVDRYLDFPFDLSQVMFIATANNTANLATAVMDRLEPIVMPAYTDEEKLTIGKNYLLVQSLSEAGMDSSKIKIDDQVWPMIIRPLGFDAGIRSLSRTIESLVRKVARQMVEGNPGPFIINAQNIGQYVSN